MFGWTGTILRVDLTSGKIEREPLSERLGLDYLGGRGINSRILYDEVKPGTDAFGEENKLILGSGPLNGTMAPASGRFSIAGKSPVTNLGRANSGGFHASEMKYAGYDHIVISGRASKPVYLWIENDHVELRDASHLWGQVVSEANRLIREETDPNVQIASIGPFGEKLGKLSCVMVSEYNACGRCGLGAVMGSKNLKAVAIRGTKGVRVAQPEAYRKLIKVLHQRVKENPRYPTFSLYGTTVNLDKVDEAAMTSPRNMQESGHWSKEKLAAVRAETLYKNYSQKWKACHACPIHCRSWVEINEGPYAGLKGIRIEYAVQLLGPMADVTYAPALYKIAQICDEYSIDQLEYICVLAAAMEWYQRGFITQEDTGGIKLEWGNWQALVEMTEKVARREGFGDVLADGGVIAAQKVGQGALDCLSYSKGAVETADDAMRTNMAWKLGLATSTRGADHLSGAVFYRPGVVLQKASMWKGPKISESFEGYEDQAAPVYFIQTICTLADALGLCKFATQRVGEEIGLDEMAELFTTATGIETNAQALTDCADRIWTVERAFLVREGTTRQDDNLFGRAMKDPVPSGPYKGLTHDQEKWERLIDEYYSLVGWDKDTGVPTQEKLKELGLEDICNELRGMGKL
ncbi:MAG: aldehyde ferredoxin oxidoreductase family protein [Chloroflexi bacterium]|nr:aldehyde ferredoxin oxidoreductase family protein [Chloroflexota bacterium]